jgi:hypothetical protein
MEQKGTGLQMSKKLFFLLFLWNVLGLHRLGLAGEDTNKLVAGARRERNSLLNNDSRRDSKDLNGV